MIQDISVRRDIMGLLLISLSHLVMLEFFCHLELALFVWENSVRV